MNNDKYIKYINIINWILTAALIVVGIMIIYENFFKSTDEYSKNEDFIKKIDNTKNENFETKNLFEKHIKNADQYMSLRRWDKAIFEYNNALKIKQDAIYPKTQLTKIYIIQNDLLKAEELIKEIESILGQTPTSIILKAKILFKKEDFEGAKNMILDKIKNMEKDDELMYHLAISYIALSDYKNAQKILKDIKYNEKTIQKAKQILNTFDELKKYRDYTNATANVFLAKPLIINYDIDTARYILKKAINEVRDYKDAWIYLSVTYIIDKKYEEALGALKNALSVAPEDPLALFYLGEVFFATEKYQDAIGAYNKALEYGYENKNVINDKLARAYILTNQYDLAKMIYTKYIITEENAKNLSAESYSKPIWLMLYKIKDIDLALQFAYIALKNIDNAITNNNVGWVLLEKGDLEEAEKYLKKAISIDDKYAPIYLNLGDLYVKKNNKEKAKQYYQTCFDIDKSETIGELCLLKLQKL